VVSHDERVALTRRQFLQGALAVMLPASLGASALPLRYVEAVRGRAYPGRVAPLDEVALARSAKWLG